MFDLGQIGFISVFMSVVVVVVFFVIKCLKPALAGSRPIKHHMRTQFGFFSAVGRPQA